MMHPSLLRSCNVHVVQPGTLWIHTYKVIASAISLCCALVQSVSASWHGMQVNAFFLKFILWLPPLNPLNTYRLTLLFLLAVPATKVCCDMMCMHGTDCSDFTEIPAGALRF